ncbi:MAG: ATP-dependent DNA helicase, partial [Thaumarchaeota archaeon]|nr:ATP-dependent DNA helicase [Nitrososphaerota archaeon]
QYISSDLPTLLQAAQLAGHGFTFATAKGRSNYACLQKLPVLEEDPNRAVTQLERWAMLQSLPLSRGDKESVPDHVNMTDSDWRGIAADDDCEKRGCPFYGNGALPGGSTRCFVFDARKQFLEAQIVVTNHTLLLLDRQMCTEASPVGPLLDKFDLLIVDEAHTLPDKAQGTWGYEFGPRTISNTLKGIDRMMKRAGVDVFEDGWQDTWFRMEEKIFAPFQNYVGKSLPFHKIEKADVEDSRVAAIDMALPELRKLHKRIGEEGIGAEDAAASAKERLGRMYKALQAVYTGDGSENDDEAGNWLSFIETEIREHARHEADRKYVKMKVKPIEVGPLMRTKIWETIPQVVMASATLRVQRSFGFIKKESGAPSDVNEFIGKTPFDFRNAVQGYFPTDKALMPPDRKSISYSDDLRRYNNACADRIVQLMEHTGGGALILFTSVSAMRDAHVLVRAMTDIPCMCQGDAPKHVLVSRMKEDVHSCLFATKSFFTGVDIPGEALRLLILMRAPFKVPGEPMFEARCDKLEARGGSPFRDLSLPLMLMDLLQGFGRLIRTETDKGVFALLDARANTKGYGEDIKKALPKIGELVL